MVHFVYFLVCGGAEHRTCRVVLTLPGEAWTLAWASGARSPRGTPVLLLTPGQDVVLMRALRDMNLPKFVFEDVPLFLGLISDLFPGLDCPRVRYPDFNDAVEQALEERGYVVLPVQVSHVPAVLRVCVRARAHA